MLIHQLIYKDLYYISGNLPNANPSKAQRLISEFSEKSDIDFDQTISFLKILPIEFISSKSKARLSDMDKSPRIIKISCSECSVLIMKVTIFSNYSEIKYIHSCKHISVRTEKIKEYNYKNNLEFLYSFQSYNSVFVIGKNFNNNYPLYVIGKVIYNATNQLNLKSMLEQLIFSKRTLLRHSDKEVGSSLDEILHKFNGHIKIGCFNDKYQNFPFIYNGKSVQFILWIAPWAIGFLNNNGYFQIDASFKALKPYVYCIPLLIQNNCSIPLGISIGPSENYLLFNLFFEYLHDIYTNFDLKKYHILSDEGLAIAKFVEINEASQFLCYRHLIESVGSCSPIGAITKRLLFMPTLVEFETALPQALSDVNELIKNNMVTKKGLLKFIKIFELSLNNDQIVIQSNGSIYKNGLWWRSPFGISTCSNHIERLHLTMNNATKSIRNLSKRLNIVITELYKCYNNYSINSRRQVYDVINKLLEISNRNPDLSKDNCHCSWKHIYENRFGIPNFPCVHTVHNIDNFNVDNLETPKTYDTQNSFLLCDAYSEWNRDIVKCKDEKNMISGFQEEEFNELYNSTNENIFLSRVVNEIYYLKKFKVDKTQLAIEISLKWKEISTNYNIYDLEFRSCFFCYLIKKYLNNE